MKDVQPSPVIPRPLRIALLCDFHKGVAGTILDHIQGIGAHSRHTVTPINFRGDLPRGLDLARFDGVIIHYSLVACHDSYLSPASRVAIRRFPGLKIAFVQDDYRFIDATVDALAAMKIDILFGLAPPDIIDAVYSPARLPGVRRETVLAGYVPERLLDLEVPPFADRPLDVGYRARKLPAWLGSHAQEKWIIADRFLRDAPAYGLLCNISCRESDRLYGEAWIRFLTNCKAVLGSESGSGVCDFSGAIQQAVEAHQQRQPDTPFEVLRELYFKAEDGRLMMNVVSPRCFEAAALRTLMILYEGHYSGRLQPWRHYVPLRRDHSNMDEVAAILRDPARAQAIVDRAYHEVARNPDNWFRAMVAQMDRAIDDTASPAMLSPARPYAAADLDRLYRATQRRANRRRSVQKLLLGTVEAVDRVLSLLPPDRRLRVRGQLRGGVRRALAARDRLRALMAVEKSILGQFGTVPLAMLVPVLVTGDEGDFIAAIKIRAAFLRLNSARLCLRLDGRRLTLEAVDGDGKDAGKLSPPADPGEIRRLLAEGGILRIRWSGEAFRGISKTLPYGGQRDFPQLVRMGRAWPKQVAALLLWMTVQP
ncbi:MAG TPA: hypothetical protein VK196_06380 [Magnetospirillum sp.]|nr:hypothetical protein [Magnetospirillum sp.]